MVVLEVLFLAVFWAWAFSGLVLLRNTLLPRLPMPVSAEQVPLPIEEVRFRATDGVELAGWLITPTHPEAPWLILCHGLGTNRADLLDLAAGLHGEGFGLLLFDFRAHGESAGRATSFGFREQRDLEGALAFLGSRPEVPARPYGVYGVSMGGAVALLVAAEDERIGAVVADSAYADLERSMDDHRRLLSPWLPRVPFLWFLSASYRLRFGVWPKQVAPTAAISNISPRPVLLIQGASDPQVPVGHGRMLLERAREPKDLWVVEDGGHLGAYAGDVGGYTERVVGLFRGALGSVVGG